MNKTRSEAEAFFGEFNKLCTSVLTAKADVMFGVPYTLLESCLRLTKGTEIKIASQNVNEKASGAFTGEISTAMLTDIGIAAAIIGHSERRQYYNETDQKVCEKTAVCLEQNILPIVCVGETLEQRESGKTAAVIETQVNAVIKNIKAPKNLVIAYEPVWAIGTGKTASKEQAQEVHAQIRKLLSATYGSETAKGIRILYGGSVTPANAKELLAQPDIDGALVGGASLKPKDFSDIVSAV